jgi:hypothetical protein
MSLVVALFVLFLVGCWLYSLTDIVLTQPVAFRRRGKVFWFTLVALTFAFGAIAWLFTKSRAQDRSYRWTAADEAAARHPAGRSREAATPCGPDDDPDFLRQLDRIIHGEDRA